MTYLTFSFNQPSHAKIFIRKLKILNNTLTTTSNDKINRNKINEKLKVFLIGLIKVFEKKINNIIYL
jgi:hypothetical protein